MTAAGERPARDFSATRVWVFDLDNTLYPATCDLFAQIDQRMSAFIATTLGLDDATARTLQKQFYREFGTTLAGLMATHAIAPERFLDYVHDIDYSPVPASPSLAAAIERLPGRKLIFTNGSRRHCDAVTDRLGVRHLFEGVFDIVDAGYVPKPRPETYDRFLAAHGVEPSGAAMFEDLPQNLVAPHALGMTTVLIDTGDNDHRVNAEVRSWSRLPDHVHHMTGDLDAFLDGLAVMPD